MTGRPRAITARGRSNTDSSRARAGLDDHRVGRHAILKAAESEAGERVHGFPARQGEVAWPKHHAK